jgi:two-component system chemotaxis response regulator CheY
MPTVLLVDDNRVQREVLKVYLMARPVTVLEAGDGQEALGVIRARRPNVVICDMRMPKLDGPGLCRALAADPAFQNLPVIILTGQQDDLSLHTCLSAGASVVLTKPVEPAALISALDPFIKSP